MKEVDAELFESEVLKAEGDVLVDFNADWCGPCQMMKPVLEEFANEHDEIKVVGVNIDENEDLAAEYHVSSIPCLVLFREGKEIRREVGMLPKKKVEKFVGEA